MAGVVFALLFCAGPEFLTILGVCNEQQYSRPYSEEAVLGFPAVGLVCLGVDAGAARHYLRAS